MSLSLALGMPVANVPHNDKCRDRIGELIAEDDDQRQVERVSGTVRPEFEIPRPEAGEEVDVGEPTVVEDQQPTPTVRRANETNTDDRETKRVRFTESRGQKRQGEDEEEHHRRQEEEQHLDADVEIPAHKTWWVEDVVGDAANAAPEQMNNFELSKTEVFKKIDESLRPLMMMSRSCAYSRKSWMRVTSQQYSIRRSSRHVQRGWDYVKGSQWI